MDIELAAQTVALIAGSPARSVERQIAAGTGVSCRKRTRRRWPRPTGWMWRLHAARGF
jgi:[glutamine synthetase] adenylyltransferase / [glutamine synthetase]-adenylyl-L-tyrosine phosphorylase